MWRLVGFKILIGLNLPKANLVGISLFLYFFIYTKDAKKDNEQIKGSRTTNMMLSRNARRCDMVLA